MRFPACLVLFALLASVFAPAIIVVDFLLERDRITSELCVQRLVPEQMRTCHGNCYLSRTLRKVEQQERALPDELRTMRLPEVVFGEHVVGPCASASPVDRTFNEPTTGTCPGWRSTCEPVPWA
jgi:hypothetical protein